MPPRPSTDARRGRRVFAALLATACAVRLILPFVGRTTVEDPFYLRNALAVSLGDRLYEDVPHVAFPFVEWLYAAVFRATGGSLPAASWLTGLIVVSYALAVRSLVRSHHGERAGLFAAACVLFAVPTLAFHWFERELASGAFAAAAAALLLSAREPGPRRALAAGCLLALALAAKLTAIWTVAAILCAALLGGRSAAARSAALATCALLLSATAWLTARHQGEFLVPTFLFFFFRGEAHDPAARALVAWSHLGPLLALGLAAIPFALAARLRLAALGLAVALAYGSHYGLVASSFWNHNVLDFLWPAALGVGLLARLAGPARASAVALALLLALPQTGWFAALRPTWFPLGFGGPQEASALVRARWLSSHSSPGEFVVADPETSLRARRRSIAADWEIEPVVRGLLAEVRLSGFARALSRRREPALLGGGAAAASAVDSRGPLFGRRVIACSLFHMTPRLADSIRLGEPAAVLEPLPPGALSALPAAGYRPEEVSGTTGWRRPR